MELKIEEVISKVMNDKTFLEGTFEGGKNYFPKDFRAAIKHKLAIVLNYYLITSDTQTNYSFEDILSRFQVLLKNTNEVELRKIIKDGYLTHSFNGSSKEYMQKYGFDYMTKSNEQELNEINKKRERLDYLSRKYGENYYIKEARKIR